MYRKILVLAVYAHFLSAQDGVEIGLRLTTPLAGPLTTARYPQGCTPYQLQPTYCDSASIGRHVAVGPTISAPLAAHFRLRVDAAYERLGIDNLNTVPVSITAAGPFYMVVGKTATTANRWQVRALAERGLAAHIRLAAGPASSTLTTDRTITQLRNPLSGDTTFNNQYFRPESRRTVFGAAVSAEFPFAIGKLVLAPEVRYTRWFAKHYGGASALDEVVTGIAIRFRSGQ
jgi:hypothetical protein